jgi:uncharacterized phage protein gp47/JayE
MTIQIQTFEQILGAMVRKVIADTSLNDVNAGSVLLTLLEAAAQVDFENNAAILNVLELLSIDAVTDSDLDARAADLGLDRIPAQRASGLVDIGDSTITKRSTGLYQVKPAPIAGQTTIFVNNASEFAATGEIFIGRGTPNFEGPISYSAIVNNGTFFEIQLDSALEKDHLISDIVVDSQNTTNRLIPAGTSVIIPANNQQPQIEYRLLRDAVIPSGEDAVTGVSIVAILSGSSGNAGINTITQFLSAPFNGATVTNTSSLNNGRDIETDDELRERVKSYSNTLARGTKQAILAAIIGQSDSVDNKQVASAVITEPPKIGDPSIVYIDDGSGFQPSFVGQSVDSLLADASGNEEFLQLANFPLPRPQSINTVDGPFELVNAMVLNVLVDGVEESVTFTTADFANISSATTSEVIIAINNQATTFKARFTNDSARILLSPVEHDVETIQVLELRSTDNEALYANNQFKFPTNEFSYIKLYQNNRLLREKQTSATLITTPFASWNITNSGNVVISVDGTPQQDVSFTTSDFNNTPFLALELSDWVTAFNAKFAGMTATATSSGRMQIVSNKEGATSSIDVIGGDYFDIWFAGENTSATGQDSEFELNRQTGNLRILTDIAAGDSITAGVSDAKGNVTSTATITGSYNVATDGDSRPAEMVVIADSDDVEPRIGVGIAIGNIITITDEGNGVMRLTSDSLSSFAAVQPHDFIYIASRGAASPWINPANSGLFKVTSKGNHITPDVDSFIEMKKDNIVPGVHTVEASEDIQAFSADTYPQLWKGTFTPTPASAPIQDVVDSFNDNLVNVTASIFKTNSVKVSSTTEDGGSFSTPISIGNSTLLFDSAVGEQKGNPSHIANKIASSDIVSLFKITPPTNTNSDGVAGKTVFLDRYTYSDVKGLLTATVTPGEEGTDTYSEILESNGVLVPGITDYDDYISFTSGNNKNHYRTIRDILSADSIGTQFALPTSIMDHVENDQFSLFRPVAINSEDSIIFIMDQDSVAKTIDIVMSRTGRINSDFPSTNFSFSADDIDNEAGITFGTLQVWGKATNNTEFQDYAVWMRARNWYQSGGVGSGLGAMVVRANEYGPHGEKIRFQIEYPAAPLFTANLSHDNNPGSTLATYTFGSGPEIPIALANGDTITVSEPSPNVFRYTFPGTVTLGAVGVDDIISIRGDAGLSAANSGVFSVVAVNDAAKTLDVYNPNGSATGVGTAEETRVDTIDDIIGTPTVSTITTVAGAGLDGTYFLLEDSDGDVAVYFDGGTANPGGLANRSIDISITGLETSSEMAILTRAFLNADPRFSASAVVGSSFSVTNEENGALPSAVDGGAPTGFTLGGAAGTPDVSLDGLYFTIQDAAGSVGVWYDATGGTSVPLGAAASDRQIEISITPGDTDDVVASKTAAVLSVDPAWSSVTVGGAGLNEITIVDAAQGGRSSASAGDSGFTVTQLVNGITPGVETVALTTSIKMYSLASTTTAEISAVINTSLILRAAPIGLGTLPIVKATRDEQYTPAGIGDYSLSLGYGHDPDPANGFHDYVSFYDSLFHVKDFSNLDPHFTLKEFMILPNVAPSVYTMETAPNDGTTDLGEQFKLVPVTLNNVLHHFTQKALSQLPIVADVDIANNIRSVQVKSKELGSEGAVEVIGGNGNSISLSAFDTASTAFFAGREFTELKTAAFPVTITSGDFVEVTNSISVQRANRLTENDTIDVNSFANDDVEYLWNPKAANLTSFVRFTISDVSALHGRPAGVIWRWEHNDGGSVFDITDQTLGTPTPPADYDSGGVVDAANLEVVITEAGDLVNAQNFQLTVSALPAQADYFAFESPSGDTFAVWFDVDANGTTPVGGATPYGLATFQIEVDILSTDSEDQIVSKLAAVLLGDVNFQGAFTGIQVSGATFGDVVPGDLLSAYGAFAATWSAGNLANNTGDNNVAGFPIIAVDATNRYVDVVNPRGDAMADEFIGTGSVQVNPTPVIQWPLAHSSRIEIASTTVVGTDATVSTVTPHRLKVGSTVTIEDNDIADSDVQPVTVDSVSNPTTFTYTTGHGIDETINAGTMIDTSVGETRYRIESLGFNDLFRLAYVDGDAPGFTDGGAAVDDFITITGSTFKTNNSGVFRILGVDNDSVIYQNSIGSEELDTLRDFNNIGTPVIWVANSDTVLGALGSFKNVVLGDWVKKSSDTDDLYLQVIELQDDTLTDVSGTPELATRMILGGLYGGTTNTAEGIAFDQLNDIGKGKILRGHGDIVITEGDSVKVGDQLFVDNIAIDGWFSSTNSGTFDITQFGTDGTTYSPFVRSVNTSGSSQTNRLLSIDNSGFFILEGSANRYKSIRQVEHNIIDQFDPDKRVYYLYPPGKEDKLGQAFGTQISPIGKLDYQADVVTGIDGYTYYTGLLRTVQRIIDGFEPDPSNFPGRRAVGGVIEILPPLIRRVTVSIDITTNEGVNINEISNDIVSAIIDYISNLGVGEDVIMAEIIVAVMDIKGVAAVTFNVPSPDTERISIADDEKAFIEINDISVS